MPAYRIFVGLMQQTDRLQGRQGEEYAPVGNIRNRFKGWFDPRELPHAGRHPIQYVVRPIPIGVFASSPLCGAVTLWGEIRRSEGEFSWLDIDPCYLGLGVSDSDRIERYREFVRSTIPVGEWELIREALQRGQLTGNDRFVNEVEAIIGGCVMNRKQGRHRKETEK